MQDLINSIKLHLYERATSPLFGTFVVSWAAWNYQFILVIFSSLPVDEKIDYISTFIYPCYYTYLLEGALYPLLTTTAFIFLYPTPARFVYKFVRHKQKELKEEKQKIDDETPLTLEESKKIRRDMTLLDIEYEKELNRVITENQRLKEIISEHNDNAKVNSLNDMLIKEDNTQNDKEKIFNDLNDEQLDLLKLIANNKQVEENQLASRMKIPSVKVQYYLGELLKLKLIEDHYAGNGKTFTPTHKGLIVLIKKGIIQ